MIELVPHGDGLLLPVRAQPGARKNGLRGQQQGMLKVCVTQVAEKGKANQAIAAEICRALGLRKSQIELVTGATATHKKFLIRQIGLDDLRARIDRALASVQA